MPLESATYIDSLNAGNPAAGDVASQGDDHIRLLKQVIKATFPNITGAVTGTQVELNVLDGLTASTAELNILDGATLSVTELNYVDGVTSGIQAQFSAMNTSLSTATALVATNLAAAIATLNTDLDTKEDTLGFIPVQQGSGSLQDPDVSVRIGKNDADAMTSLELAGVPKGNLVLGTTDSVPKEIAAITVGAVGDIALMNYTPGTALAPGASVAGATLRWAGLGVSSSGDFTSVYIAATVPAGTWQAMCNLDALVSGSSYAIGLFKRIS